jgi:hypothetical protein
VRRGRDKIFARHQTTTFISVGVWPNDTRHSMLKSKAVVNCMHGNAAGKRMYVEERSSCRRDMCISNSGRLLEVDGGVRGS